LFRGYYETAKLELPDDMELREFAIQPFGSESYVRHLSFTSEQELRSFLIEKVPLQVYFSAGKYQSPSAPDMESKGWMGSDLMFDLDADEFCELNVRRFCMDTGEEVSGDECASNNVISYSEVTAECLKQVYEKATLLKDVLKDDFGLEGEIIFSGNRGFHVNVNCYGDCALLDREDRKKIVEYLTDPRVEPGSPSDFGWAGRLARGVRPLKLDEQVTIDIHRLRRIPGSINGKSGLPVFRMSSASELDNLLSRSPFKGSKVVIQPLVTGELNVYNVRVTLKKDLKVTINSEVGIYLALKGLVRLTAHVK
jgi:DNA primase small subunit